MGCQYSIMIVGCGGTGGNFIKEFARYLYSLRDYQREKYKVVLVDGDVVEEKNIIRQPFIKEDIGRNKAEVMAEIMMESFGVSCRHYAEFIDSADNLEKLVERDSIPILIGCVDNHQCRKTMHQFFERQSTCFYLDSANEYSVGEVVFAVKLSDMVLYPDRVQHFPEILMDQTVKRSEESCIELSSSAPQHLVTNLYAATILLSLAVMILNEEEFLGGIYYFDAFKGYSRQSLERL